LKVSALVLSLRFGAKADSWRQLCAFGWKKLTYEVTLQTNLQFLQWRSYMDKRKDPRLTESVRGAG